MGLNKHLFESQRTTMQEAIDLTIRSLRTYGERYSHWCIAYSGGKDSSATVTLVAHLIKTGQIPAHKSLIVLYADTRMELPPLQFSAMRVLQELNKQGMETRVVLPSLDHRYFVYIFFLLFFFCLLGVCRTPPSLYFLPLGHSEAEGLPYDYCIRAASSRGR